MEHSFRLGFKASKNEAEYEALIAGLRAVLNLGAREVEVYLDSRLVVNQVQDSFEAKDQIDRGHNWHADSLATLVSSLTKEVPRLIKEKVVAEPSIDAKVGVLVVVISELCWMDPIINILAED